MAVAEDRRMVAVVTAGRLNVRAGPSLQHRRLSQLERGAVVAVVGQRNAWLEVRRGEQTGFVARSYVDLHERVPRLQGIVVASRLNVRDRPSLAGSVAGRLAEGAVIAILADHGDWLEVPFGEGTGFVARDYVEPHTVEAPQRGTVTARVLNLRGRPSLDAPVVGQLPEDSAVIVEACLGRWLQIPFQDGKAYVAGDFVRLAQIPDDEVAGTVVAEVDEEAPAPSAAPVETPEPEPTPARSWPVTGNAEQRNVAATWNRFGGLLGPFAQEREIDLASAVAVLCVESAGKGFEPSNGDRLIVRFENHKFWRFWGRADPERFRTHFTYSERKVWQQHRWRERGSDPWQGFHGSQRAEWEVLEFARRLDGDAALLSTSMGAPQIMGFHHERIGYRTPREMLDAFGDSMAAQVKGLFDFLSPAMIEMLRERDFAGFARLYNGSGQATTYGRRLASHHQACRRFV